MTYPELIEYMHKYRTGKIKHTELIFAICLWQAGLSGGFVAIQNTRIGPAMRHYAF